MASLGTLPGEHKELLGGLLIGIAAGVTISRLLVPPVLYYDGDSGSNDSDSSDDDDDDDDSEWEDVGMGDGSGLVLLQEYPEDDYKMVLVVRNDLKMNKGKIAAQCGHATLACFKSSARRQPEVLRVWEQHGQAKVALKCSDDDDITALLSEARAAGLVAQPIRDAGRTQVAAGTRTVMAIGPGPKTLIDRITGHLKLL